MTKVNQIADTLYTALVTLRDTNWKSDVRRASMHVTTQTIMGTNVGSTQFDEAIALLEQQGKINVRRKTTGRRETFLDLV